MPLTSHILITIYSSVKKRWEFVENQIISKIKTVHYEFVEKKNNFHVIKQFSQIIFYKNLLN